MAYNQQRNDRHVGGAAWDLRNRRVGLRRLSETVFRTEKSRRIADTIRGAERGKDREVRLGISYAPRSPTAAAVSCTQSIAAASLPIYSLIFVV